MITCPHRRAVFFRRRVRRSGGECNSRTDRSGRSGQQRPSGKHSRESPAKSSTGLHRCAPRLSLFFVRSSAMSLSAPHQNNRPEIDIHKKNAR